MKIVEVPAQEVRLPAQAIEALAAHVPVAVTRYGRRQHVVLAEEQFRLVAPLLELLEEGVAVSPELLMAREDIELERDLARDREPSDAENAQIEALLAEADA